MMRLPSSLANAAWAASSVPGWLRFRRALARPADAQVDLLRTFVSRHAESAYGREHGFGGIGGYDDFAQRVPAVDYADLDPWIARIQAGESNILVSERVERLVPTSGSVGARKLIPFTSGLQAAFNRALGPWMADLFFQFPELMRGPAYWSITPAVQSAGEASAVPIGFEDDSRYLGGVRQRLVESIMATPSALRLVPDIDDFTYLTLLCLLRCRDLRLISVWHPSFLTLLLDALLRHWNELLGDLQSGGSTRTDRLPASVRALVNVRPMPGRAAQLRTMDPRKPEGLWPHLRVLSCWRDAHAELAAEELVRRFPHTILQAKGLLATEAFVTIPFGDQHPVAVRSHFFEFMDESGRLCLVHQLRPGESYEVLVTNGGGLWRYRLHDRVMVKGHVGSTPSLRFLGKGDNVSDRFGEKLSEAFVGEVLREVAATLPEPPRFAMLAPEAEMGTGGGGRYILYLEGSRGDDLGAKLDAGLRRNPQYAWSRSLGQLGEVAVVSIDAGGYESFVAREMQHGRRLGEIKPVALSTRTGWTAWFHRSERTL